MVGVGMIREDMLNTCVGRKREREGEKHITRREKEQERGRDSWGGGVGRERERKRERQRNDTGIHRPACLHWSHVFLKLASVVHSLHSLDVYPEHYNPPTCAIGFQQQCQQQNKLAKIPLYPPHKTTTYQRHSIIALYALTIVY